MGYLLQQKQSAIRCGLASCCLLVSIAGCKPEVASIVAYPITHRSLIQFQRINAGGLDQYRWRLELVSEKRELLGEWDSDYPPAKFSMEQVGTELRVKVVDKSLKPSVRLVDLSTYPSYDPRQKVKAVRVELAIQ